MVADITAGAMINLWPIIFDYAGQPSWFVISRVCIGWKSIIAAKLAAAIDARGKAVIAEIRTGPIWRRTISLTHRSRINPNIFRPGLIDLHDETPTATEILLMNPTDDWPHSQIIRRWFVLYPLRRRLVHCRRFWQPLSLPTTIDSNTMQSAMDEPKRIISHFMRHPPAALAVLEEFIREFNITSDPNQLGRYLFIDSDNLLATSMAKDLCPLRRFINVISLAMMRQSGLQESFEAATEIEKEFLLVATAVFYEWIKIFPPPMLQYIRDIAANIHIRYPLSRGIVASCWGQ